MEKDGFCSWQSDSQSAAVADESQLGASSMANSCRLNLNWDQSSTDQNCNFESALSSLVSSPTSSHPNLDRPNIPSCDADNVVIRELIGRLGSICSNDSSPCTNSQSCYHSTNTSSCYSTPLNSPPKLDIAMIHDHPRFQFPPPHHPITFAADAGFAERAAMFSCFGGNRGIPDLQEHGKMSRASSSQCLKAMAADAPPDVGIGGQLADSDPTSPIDGNVIRKRKADNISRRGGGGGGIDASPANPSHVAEYENLTTSSKRCRSVADAFPDGADSDAAVASRTPKMEHGNTNRGSEQGQKQRRDKDNVTAKPPEHPKLDFIHVRARRGQATDSHSLAERVRRERISERMKFLQDLVPSCNKVTGKAVMLDEIINYVQSLQRQVEFLSMKLATVDPRLDFHADSLLSKDIHQPPWGPMMPPPQSPYPLEASCSSTGLSYGNQLPQGQVHPHLQSLMGGNGALDNNSSLDATSLRRSLSMQLHPLDGFIDTAASSQSQSQSQQGAFWEDDLHSVVQMGSIGQNPEDIFSSHSFHGM